VAFYARAAVMMLALLLLSAFSYLRPGHLEPGVCLRGSEACVGHQVQLSHDARVTQLLPDGFVVEQLGATVRVVGSNAGLAVGDGIQLRGTWQADGAIRAEAWHVSRERRWRISVSIPAALLGAWLFWRTFRWDGKRLAFTPRDHA
jgi:hypothetical protein